MVLVFLSWLNTKQSVFCVGILFFLDGTCLTWPAHGNPTHTGVPLFGDEIESCHGPSFQHDPKGLECFWDDQLISQMPSGHGKTGILFGWLSLKGNLSPKKENRAPLGNWDVFSCHDLFSLASL